ncbi:MAG: NnrU family protein [Betaproteobacteria bacterium]
MALLVTGLLVFFAPHFLPMARGRRASLLAQWGEGRYKGVFSAVSGVGLLLIIAGYAYAERGAQWFAPSPLARSIAPEAMTLVFILLASSHGTSHIRAWIKHPMLVAVLIWSVLHLLANGDARGTILFGSFAAYALIDLVSAVSRGAFVAFAPRWKSDAIAVVAGAVVALLVMLLHRILFGVGVVSFGV